MVGLVIALITLAIFFSVRGLRRARTRALLDAVRRGDFDEVRRRVGRGGKRVNSQDRRGDSALHVAYHAGREELIGELVSLGANVHLFNVAGFTPPQMVYLRQAEDLINELAELLEPAGGWRDPSRARDAYDQLRALGSRVVTLALSNVVAGTAGEEQRAVLLVAIKLGDGVLVQAVTGVIRVFGTEQIAEDFVNSGSPWLEQAAAHWAQKHRCVIAGEGEGRARWGVF
jgi:hypothetical protein